MGGFSIVTAKLSQRITQVIHPPRRDPDDWSERDPVEEPIRPVIHVHDEAARLYQHSKRAQEEHLHFTPFAKYCVGLARYVRNPLNEYAALGRDILALNFDSDIEQQVNSRELYITHH